jgi:hypothetical protein
MGKKAKKGVSSFSLSADIMDAMLRIKEVDGIPLSQQAERALRMWLGHRAAPPTAPPPVEAPATRGIYIPKEPRKGKRR